MSGNEPVRGNLTHWGRDKMATISQTHFSNTFWWMKTYEFRLIFHWSLFLRVKLSNPKKLYTKHKLDPYRCSNPEKLYTKHKLVPYRCSNPEKIYAKHKFGPYCYTNPEKLQYAKHKLDLCCRTNPEKLYTKTQQMLSTPFQQRKNFIKNGMRWYIC